VDKSIHWVGAHINKQPKAFAGPGSPGPGGAHSGTTRLTKCGGGRPRLSQARRGPVAPSPTRCLSGEPATRLCCFGREL